MAVPTGGAVEDWPLPMTVEIRYWGVREPRGRTVSWMGTVMDWFAAWGELTISDPV
ncbi:MAG: hypothetical protein WDO18_20310 [Acidobacteriota bacterium]